MKPEGFWPVLRIGIADLQDIHIEGVNTSKSIHSVVGILEAIPLWCTQTFVFWDSLVDDYEGNWRLTVI